MSRPASTCGPPRIGARARCAGFTLIEILIVIAVIALLISILLPSLAGARDAAYRVKCQVNQRQLITATSTYAGAFKGVLPMPNWASQDPALGWLYQPPLQPLESQRQDGLLWPYLEVDAVYRCPRHREPYKGSAVVTSYLMNGAVAGYGRARHSFFIDQFRPGSMIFWEADENGRFAWNDGASYPREGLTTRHGKTATVAVVDGSTRPVSRQEYNDLLNKSPGPLWCAPDTRTGH